MECHLATQSTHQRHRCNSGRRRSQLPMAAPTAMVVAMTATAEDMEVVRAVLKEEAMVRAVARAVAWAMVAVAMAVMGLGAVAMAVAAVAVAVTVLVV